MASQNPKIPPLIFESGPYRGRTVEWIMFNDPSWIFLLTQSTRIHLKHEPKNIDLLNRCRELRYRGRVLRVPCGCTICGETPAKHMALLKSNQGRIIDVRFVCKNCTLDRFYPVAVTQPSFFPSEAMRTSKEAKIVAVSIRHAYFGADVDTLSQETMEAFFATPANFP